MPLTVSSAVLAQAFSHCEGTYPDEGCGVLVGPAGEDRAVLFEPCGNIQNQMHGQDPVRYPRDARTAYLIDPQDLFRLTHRLREEGMSFKAVVHSHADVGAYFSDEDQRQAAPVMNLSITAFARGEGLPEDDVRARLARGDLPGDAGSGMVKARIPVYPDQVYIVVDVANGQARGYVAFAWDAVARTYVETGVDVTEDSTGEFRESTTP
ncbi:MAG: Mov34/MPN/PAD-1 family protein [Leptospirillia bacterium]